MRLGKENEEDVQGLTINSDDSESAINYGGWGSAINYGSWGSAANSGIWGRAINSGWCGSAINSAWCGSATNSGVRGSAIDSGWFGSAVNSGDWGISVSNTFCGKITNKKGCFSMITEPILNSKEKQCGQNAKLIKFTSEMEGKYYTLLKGELFEVISFDGIDVAVLETKTINNYGVYKGIVLDPDIYLKRKTLGNLDKVYVVAKDGVYSHGETIESAIADFRYKIGNRDASDFEYFRKEKGEIPTDEIIKGYRAVTGACEFGTKQFVSGLENVKDSYTIKEAVEILKSRNAYECDKFIAWLKGENNNA